MDKLKLNIIGDTFTYRHSGNKGFSVHQKEAKHLEWTQDGSGVGSVYVDVAVHRGQNFNFGGPRYAWLYESKFIVPGPTADVLSHTDWYLDNFDLIFTHDQEILALSDKCKFVPANGIWIEEPKMYHKSKLVSMISSNKLMTDGHRERLNWVERLRSQLDLYGRGFNSIDSKESGLCDYMFSVTIENGCYSSYFTEKILDCFATGTIPIYLGSPDIGDFFNLDGIIPLTDDFSIDELTTDLYYDKLDAIKDNLNRVMDMVIPEDYMYKHYLSVRH